MYPKALMDLSPLSALCLASFPQELSLSMSYIEPAVPNPMRESDVELQLWKPIIPRRARADVELEV
mgnify:CR=1 FL=1